MPITLPTAPVKAASLSPRTLIIYGPPKIGKTTIVTALQDYLLVELERNGAAYVDAVKLELDNIFQLNGLKDAIRLATKDGKPPYQYGIIDTLDELEVWVEEEATRRYKASIIGKSFGGKSVLELPKGAGYLHLRNVFYEYFQLLRQLFSFTIYLGHVRDSILGQDGKDVSSKDLDLTGKVKNIVCAYADAIALASRNKDGKLILNFVTTDTANCGSRCAHLAGKKFEFHQPATLEDWKQIYV